MTLWTNIATPVTAVEKRLSTFFDLKTAEAALVSPWFEHLWRCTAATALGGKGVRPRLLLAAYQALLPPLSRYNTHPEDDAPPPLGVTYPDPLIEAAVATELLHLSFLLHDDVIDGDTLRRGKPNLIALMAQVNTDEGAGSAGPSPPWEETDHRIRHWARSNAILMGNLLLSEVHQIFAGLDLPSTQRAHVLQLLSHTISETVAGEQLDVGLGDGVIPPELSTILAMCGYKTATYSFEFPLRLAATLAGAPAGLDPVLTQAGHLLGIAFQLQDDLLPLAASPDDHGKDPYSDLREGKETALISYARMTTYWPLLEPIFGKPDLTASEGDTAHSYLIACGAQDFTTVLIADQLRALHDLIAQHQRLLPHALSQVMMDVAANLEGRTV